ncbi:unnamed protein product [Vitrella brassicaformis CCMP3155]|uniref:RING-type domain-containing protein n=2 Tax=Vitrella brassicaformis TaxID=1169539 RepID=A0A0G4FIS3_VITBC|nr:unnamed protein product [Vitrella brassicaformis CCMP3155]|eukprot:CEM13639.1 unnamed protein product [Vitrella brassicaformis CCMP3155]
MMLASWDTEELVSHILFLRETNHVEAEPRIWHVIEKGWVEVVDRLLQKEPTLLGQNGSGSGDNCGGVSTDYLIRATHNRGGIFSYLVERWSVSERTPDNLQKVLKRAIENTTIDRMLEVVLYRSGPMKPHEIQDFCKAESIEGGHWQSVQTLLSSHLAVFTGDDLDRILAHPPRIIDDYWRVVIRMMTDESLPAGRIHPAVFRPGDVLALVPDKKRYIQFCERLVEEFDAVLTPPVAQQLLEAAVEVKNPTLSHKCIAAGAVATAEFIETAAGHFFPNEDFIRFLLESNEAIVPSEKAMLNALRAWTLNWNLVRLLLERGGPVTSRVVDRVLNSTTVDKPVYRHLMLACPEDLGSIREKLVGCLHSFEDLQWMEECLEEAAHLHAAQWHAGVRRSRDDDSTSHGHMSPDTDASSSTIPRLSTFEAPVASMSPTDSHSPPSESVTSGSSPTGSPPSEGRRIGVARGWEGLARAGSGADDEAGVRRGEAASEINTRERNTCVVCLDAAAAVILAPCGHRCTCTKCTALLMRRPDIPLESPFGVRRPAFHSRACPICKTYIQSTVRRVYD